MRALLDAVSFAGVCWAARAMIVAGWPPASSWRVAPCSSFVLCVGLTTLPLVGVGWWIARRVNRHRDDHVPPVRVRSLGG